MLAPNAQENTGTILLKSFTLSSLSLVSSAVRLTRAKVFTIKQSLQSLAGCILQAEALSSDMRSQLRPSLLPNDFYVPNRAVGSVSGNGMVLQYRLYCPRVSFRHP